MKLNSTSQWGGVGACSGSFLYISFVWNYILWIWEVYAPKLRAALLLPRIRVLAPRLQGDSPELKLIDKGYYCHNPYSAITQLNKSWVWHENDFTPPPTTTTANSMSAISQLLLTRFWWNFKCSFLWASRTDSNYQVDICPGNICPGDICPYQDISAVTDLILMKL